MSRTQGRPWGLEDLSLSLHSTTYRWEDKGPSSLASVSSSLRWVQHHLPSLTALLWVGKWKQEDTCENPLSHRGLNEVLTVHNTALSGEHPPHFGLVPNFLSIKNLTPFLLCNETSLPIPYFYSCLFGFEDIPLVRIKRLFQLKSFWISILLSNIFTSPRLPVEHHS